MSTETDIVEKVAREICGVHNKRAENVFLHMRECYMKEARAALAVIEPELAKLRAERDAAARDMRERCIAQVLAMADQITARANSVQPTGMISHMLEGNAGLIRDVAKALAMLPDTPAVIATDETGGGT